LGNPGLANGFCATLKQGIGLNVRYKTPPLPLFFFPLFLLLLSTLVLSIRNPSSAPIYCPLPT
jgi:hypothetical protein